ncbi:hypothetical protein V6N12_048108 [Hibiscus sabdariffa]|uniref:CCHC-type domain-containing protein n=1 Tax=Hibiscus sabdariffa TaxID=183260 RepID=A0ABR2CUX4_9ROSI
MTVSINLRKPLVSKLVINGHIQIIEYESMLIICFHCGIYGHVKDLCPKLSRLSCPNEIQQDSTPPPTPVPEKSAPGYARRKFNRVARQYLWYHSPDILSC